MELKSVNHKFIGGTKSLFSHGLAFFAMNWCPSSEEWLISQKYMFYSSLDTRIIDHFPQFNCFNGSLVEVGKVMVKSYSGF